MPYETCFTRAADTAAPEKRRSTALSDPQGGLGAQVCRVPASGAGDMPRLYRAPHDGPPDFTPPEPVRLGAGPIFRSGRPPRRSQTTNTVIPDQPTEISTTALPMPFLLQPGEEDAQPSYDTDGESKGEWGQEQTQTPDVSSQLYDSPRPSKPKGKHQSPGGTRYPTRDFLPYKPNPEEERQREAEDQMLELEFENAIQLGSFGNYFFKGWPLDKLEQQNDYEQNVMRIGDTAVKQPIDMQGMREHDYREAATGFNQAHEGAGLTAHVANHIWHHEGNYAGGTCTMALVDAAYHKSHMHYGAVAQWRRAHRGVPYG